MALRAVPEHPKFAGLKSRLGLTKFQTLGLLEALWHFTGKYAPRGNVGKYTNIEIEAWLEWHGEPGKAVEALTESRWIDPSQEHRLVVHDWSKCADELVHTELARRLEFFADGTRPKGGRLNQHERVRFKEWESATSQPPVSQSDGRLSHVPTKSANVPKPEPVPAPEPAPAPEPVFDHDMVATSVMAETNTGGMKLRILLTDIALNSIAAGKSGEHVRDLIVGQWNKYRQSMPKLEWTYGSLEKFLGGGLWQEPSQWPWKDGQRPARAGPDPLEELRREREAALREKQRQEANGSQSTQPAG